MNGTIRSGASERLASIARWPPRYPRPLGRRCCDPPVAAYAEPPPAHGGGERAVRCRGGPDRTRRRDAIAPGRRSSDAARAAVSSRGASRAHRRSASTVDRAEEGAEPPRAAKSKTLPGPPRRRRSMILGVDAGQEESRDRCPPVRPASSASLSRTPASLLPLRGHRQRAAVRARSWRATADPTAELGSARDYISAAVVDTFGIFYYWKIARHSLTVATIVDYLLNPC